MRAQGPTFWLLNGRLDWRTGDADNIAVGTVLRLAIDPAGPLAFTAADGSLGGLRLPQGMAFDASQLLYLLDPAMSAIKRFAPGARRFEALPSIGGSGGGVRQLREPTAIAIAGGDCYVTDTGNRRVQVFALNTLALRHVWGPWDRALQPTAADDPLAWEPVDAAAVGGRVVILDRRHGQVLAHRPGTDDVEVLIAGSEQDAGRFSRIALDTELRVYLLDAEAARLSIYDPCGRYLGEAGDPGEVLDRFPPPPIRLDHHGRFCLPAGLTRDCGREPPDTAPTPQAPLAACGADGGLPFDRYGTPVKLPADPEPVGPPLYRRQGTWISEGLDSRIFACQWHRLELTLAALPPGTRLAVKTYADDEPRAMDDIKALPDPLWETRQTVLADTAGQNAEMLVQSHPGQYLWLRLELYGDGYATPGVDAARVHYPRDSYLKHLPAVYAADDESRGFLERFLSLFQTEWDALEARIADMARYFDPDAVPAGLFLDYLAAQWLALPLEGDWDDARKRRLLAAAPALYERRGTPQALRRYLRVYLANITGIDALADEEAQTPTDPRAFPLLLEGFRKRDYLMLNAPEHARLRRRHPLWSPAVAGRLQLDVFAREGEVRLVATGDPERDLFHEHAHRFQVFVPSAWLRSRQDEDMLRRALETEKPAHTQYQLCLVAPRLRVGVQSTVGVDTIIGAYPVAVLADPAILEALPASRPPSQRLGYDTVLGGRPVRQGGMPLGPVTRVGMTTVLS